MRSPPLVAVLLLFAACLVPFLARADCVDYGDYLHWVSTLDANANSIAVSGSLAFLPFSAGLYLLDVDPLRPWGPEILSSVVLEGSGWGTYVAASGGYAYAARSVGYYQGGRLLVVDATDPSHPRLAGGLTTSGDIFAIAASGTQVYLAEGSAFAGLQVIDASDPANPHVVGSVATPGGVEGVAVSGQFAYVTAFDYSYPETASFQIVDISNPESPFIVAGIPLTGHPGAVAVAGNYAYVGGLQVVDITDPQHPSIVSTLAVPGGSKFISDTRLYIAGFGRLQVIDISDPLTPVPLGSAEVQSAGGVVTVGPNAYVAGSDLHVFRLGNGRNPPVVGMVDTPGQARDVAVAGSYAYVADHYGGLQVVDITDPGSPQIVGSAATPIFAVCVRVLDSFAYVAMRRDGASGTPGGLAVIDVADPQNPQVIGEVNTSHRSQALAIEGPYAYVVGGTDTAGCLSIIDILNPGDPRIVGILDTAGYAYSLAVSGTYAYVGVRTVNTPYVYSLRVISIANPENPHIVASLSGVPVSAVAVSGNYAYFGGGNLQVVDITDPEDPRLAGSVDPPSWQGNFGGVSVAGDFVYSVNAGSYDLVDVSDPERPQVTGTAPGGGGSVVASGDYLYAALGSYGLVIRPAQCGPASGIVERAATPSGLLLDLVPNPAAQHVGLRFTIADPGWTCASIFGVAGRLVRDLNGGFLRAGTHELPWDGRDDVGREVPAGVYLVKVTTLAGEASGRVVLTR